MQMFLCFVAPKKTNKKPSDKPGTSPSTRSRSKTTRKQLVCGNAPRLSAMICCLLHSSQRKMFFIYFFFFVEFAPVLEASTVESATATTDTPNWCGKNIRSQKVALQNPNPNLRAMVKASRKKKNPKRQTLSKTRLSSQCFHSLAQF